MPVTSVSLAVVAAVAFAVSTVLQQRTARNEARRRGRERAGWLPVLGLLRRMMRDPAWLVGWLLNVIGFGLHALALHLGAIAVVQAVLVVQLMFALMITAAWRSLRPTPRDWIGTAAVCAGIGTLVLMRGDVRQREAAAGEVVIVIAVAVAAVVTILALARRIGAYPQPRTALVAMGAGICFCVTAVCVVVVTARIAHSGVWAALDWPLVCLVASAVTGSLLVQDAFASGSLPTALTAMTITDPVVSAVVGAIVFDATPPAGLHLWLGLPAAGLLVALGVALLAGSPTLHDERRVARVPVASRRVMSRTAAG